MERAERGHAAAVAVEAATLGAVQADASTSDSSASDVGIKLVYNYFGVKSEKVRQVLTQLVAALADEKD